MTYKEKQKLYRIKNKDSIREKQRLYRMKNKDKEILRHKLYRESNVEKIRIINKKYRLNNKEKIKEINRDYFLKTKIRDKEKLRERKFKLRYGITIECFNDILKNQNYVCEISGEKFNGSKDACMDHNHITGANRGVIRAKYNKALGLFDDNINIIKSSINYLESNIDNGEFHINTKYTKSMILIKNKLILQQNNRCAICGSTFKDFRDIHLDHNHVTNRVRKVLCLKCNVALGQVNDDIVILNNMVIYLNKYSQQSRTVNLIPAEQGGGEGPAL